MAGTGQSRTTWLGAGCSLGAPQILAAPRLGVFIQTREAGEEEAAVVVLVAVAVAAETAEGPFRIPGNVSAAPRPPHASASLLARAGQEVGRRERGCARA